MKFGKELKIHLEETLPDWRDKYLCYKPLKNLLKKFPLTTNPDSLYPDQGPISDSISSQQRRVRPLMYLQEWFIRTLNEEVEKFNDFYLDKQQDYVIRFRELKSRIEKMREKSRRDGVSKSNIEYSEEMLEIRRDFVSIYGEMVLLINYSFLNFAGLLKITKKYDKRTGELLRLSFIQLALHQPFYITKDLEGLLSECEANLALLFPLEVNVTEPTSIPQDSKNPSEYFTQVSSQQPSSLDIFRSTLAAISTLSGLKRASSTYGPFSFSTLFHSQDDDGVEAVSAQNSDSATLQDGEKDVPSR